MNKHEIWDDTNQKWIDPFDLEFGDCGRSPRFTSGWWILPGLLLTFILGLIIFVGGLL